MSLRAFLSIPRREHFPASSQKFGEKRVVQKLWEEFFSHPSQWYDHRLEKANAGYPDFKHKETQESLWLNCKLNPSWVEKELAAMTPGTVQTTTFSWNRRLARYVKAGKYEEAMELFRRMQHEGMDLDKYTFVPVLNACAGLRDLEEGRCTHKQIIRNGCEWDVYVGSSLVDMYVKCGSIEDACTVFKKMPIRNAVSWSCIIWGYVKCGQWQRALELSRQMQFEEIQPDSGVFLGMLNVCAGLAILEEGRRVHAQIIESGYESDVVIANSLIDMYAKCGSMEDAWRVFNEMPNRDVVSWNAIIWGYVKCGQGLQALELAKEMEREGMEPNSVTFLGLLGACARLGVLEEGRHIHSQIIQRGCESDAYVGGSLIDMYAKCGSIENAQKTFDKIPKRDVVVWTAMIMGYVKCGQGQRALDVCKRMQEEGVEPNTVAFVGMLNACASVAALEEGRRVHTQIIERGWDSIIIVGNSLIDMYAKCGSIEDAQRVFNKMPTLDMVSWSAMLGGYARHGRAKEAFQVFERMCQLDVRVDGVTLVSLLSACSHAGLVDEGLHYIQSMSSSYNVSLTVEHYACMVDLLGYAGRLHEAGDLIRIMFLEHDASLWMSLLGACREHGNVEMGESIARLVHELAPKSAAAAVVLLSNIYSVAGTSENKCRHERCREAAKPYLNSRCSRK